MSKLIRNVNDLLTQYPLLAKEWDVVKNAGLTPEDVAAHSNKKHWWICEKDRALNRAFGLDGRPAALFAA